MTSLSVVADHLWQSTVFAAIVWALTSAFKRHHARVRYWMWMAASVKFLVPFAALVAVGGWLAWASPTDVRPDVPPIVSAVGQPLSSLAPPAIASSAGSGSRQMRWLPAVTVIVWATGCVLHLVTWLVRWRRLASIARASSPVESGVELTALRRLERGIGAAPLPLVAADSPVEPAIVGLWRPVLLWPASLSNRLKPEQIEAVLAHELCHSRHRDNVAMAVHMIVEALFWFYPIVWWIERPLIRERERACDEEVLRLGSPPDVYAESILKTCQYFLESPLRCAAGITGADLKRRIEEIMTRHLAAIPLPRWKVRALACTGATAIGAPIVVGVLLSAPVLRAQFEPVTAATPRFEVVSVKRNVSAGETAGPGPLSKAGPLPGGGYTAGGLRLIDLIRSAYRLQAAQVAGAPSWVDNERYDIEARAPGATPARNSAMLRALLYDRFDMRVHVETRELPVYALMSVTPGVLAPGLKSTGECTKEIRDLPDQPLPCGVLQSGAGQLNASGVTMGSLASMAMNMASYTGVDRIVLDRSDLTGNYWFQLRFRPVGRGGTAPVAPNADAPQLPDFFTALREELGLTLDPQSAPVEVLVIDEIERPTPD
jgi:bla regulator protein blaR1